MLLLIAVDFNSSSKYTPQNTVPFASAVFSICLLILLTFKDPGRYYRPLSIPIKSRITCFCCICVDDNYIHCYHCGTCIFKKDHHCPWIGNCISSGNFSIFMVFLVSNIVSMYFIVFCLKTTLLCKILFAISLIIMAVIFLYHVMLTFLGVSSLTFVKNRASIAERSRESQPLERCRATLLKHNNENFFAKSELDS